PPPTPARFPYTPLFRPLKATKVEGVFTSDPVKDPNAKLYRSLSYMDVLQKELKVMDATAVSLGMDNDLPLVVFDLTTRGNILRRSEEHTSELQSRENLV